MKNSSTLFLSYTSCYRCIHCLMFVPLQILINSILWNSHLKIKKYGTSVIVSSANILRKRVVLTSYQSELNFLLKILYILIFEKILPKLAWASTFQILCLCYLHTPGTKYCRASSHHRETSSTGFSWHNAV